MNDITVFAAPLPFSNKQTKTLAAPGSSLEDIFRLVTPAHLSDATIDARMEINGWLIPRENWHLVRPKPGTLVNVRIVPQGGGGGKKSPLVTILSIAVMIAAPYVGGFLTAALGNAGFWLGSTYFTSAFVYGTAFSAVSHLLISALAPPPKPSNAGVGGAVTNPTISPTQFIEERPTRSMSMALSRFASAPTAWFLPRPHGPIRNHRTTTNTFGRYSPTVMARA